MCQSPADQITRLLRNNDTSKRLSSIRNPKNMNNTTGLDPPGTLNVIDSSTSQVGNNEPTESRSSKSISRSNSNKTRSRTSRSLSRKSMPSPSLSTVAEFPEQEELMNVLAESPRTSALSNGSTSDEFSYEPLNSADGPLYEVSCPRVSHSVKSPVSSRHTPHKHISHRELRNGNRTLPNLKLKSSKTSDTSKQTRKANKKAVLVEKTPISDPSLADSDEVGSHQHHMPNHSNHDENINSLNYTKPMSTIRNGVDERTFERVSELGSNTRALKVLHEGSACSFSGSSSRKAFKPPATIYEQNEDDETDCDTGSRRTSHILSVDDVCS